MVGKKHPRAWSQYRSLENIKFEYIAPVIFWILTEAEKLRQTIIFRALRLQDQSCRFVLALQVESALIGFLFEAFSSSR